MKQALIVSLILHGIAVAGMIVSWPAADPPMQFDQVVLVELVPVAEERVLPDQLIPEAPEIEQAAQPQSVEPPSASSEPAGPTESAPAAAVAPPPPPKPKPVAVAEPVPMPDPLDKIEPEPEPRPEPEPAPETEVEAPIVPEPDTDPQPTAVAALLQDVRRPKTKPKPVTKDFESVLDDVAAQDVIESAATNDIEQAEKVDPIEDPLAIALGMDDEESPLDAQLSMLEIDAIRKQISDNWDLPAGAKDAQNMVVTLRIQLNPDGTVTNVEVVDRWRVDNEPFYRAMAESAQRAVYRLGRIQNLRPASYQMWRDMTINFDPREMF